jgi:hypothetical protein
LLFDGEVHSAAFDTTLSRANNARDWKNTSPYSSLQLGEEDVQTIEHECDTSDFNKIPPLPPQADQRGGQVGSMPEGFPHREQTALHPALNNPMKHQATGFHTPFGQ